MKNIYETHELNDKPLPFIFQLNELDSRFSDYAMNWHPNVEILYFQDGGGTVICDMHKYSVASGDIFLVNSNLSHCVTTDSAVKFYCLIIDNEFCAANSLDPEETVFNGLIKSAEASRLYRNVVAEFSSAGTYRNAGIKSAVLSLMVYIAKNYTVSEASFKKSPGARGACVRRAVSFIRSHYAEALSLDELAACAGWSKYYFIREFKAATGYTPIAYINKLRCENAKKLLLSSDFSISEICEKIGFENQSYFSKKFKEAEGCTPSQFIKKYTPL